VLEPIPVLCCHEFEKTSYRLKMSQVDNNKRIARNTLMLYIRMFVLMIVSLFSSRLVFRALGVSDYGVYNVVGGVVAMASIFNSSMSSTVQRFLNFAEGKGDKDTSAKTFSSSVYVYLLLCLVFLVLAETIGLWFVNHKLVIPEDRMLAANVIFQFIIISACFRFMSNPYNAVILAHEEMGVYAIVSCVEAVLKLLVAIVLVYFSGDRLILYGALMLLSSVIIISCYRVYCKRHYVETSSIGRCDMESFKNILKFSGWTLFGSGADLAKDQGLNILLNLFFSPVVNAARGIALQLKGLVTQFFTSFYSAVKPQIVKYYASGEHKELVSLVIRSSKFSFYLLLMVALPAMLEAPFLVDLWLGEIPEYVVVFFRLLVIASAVDSMSSPLMTTANATGRIVLYQVTLGVLKLLTLPIAYVCLRLGMAPESVFVVTVGVSCVCLLVRLVIVKYLLPAFQLKRFFVEVLVVCALVTVTSSVVPVLLHVFVNHDILRFLLTVFSSIISSLLMISLLGLSKDERVFIFGKVKRFLFRNKDERNLAR